MGKGDKKTKRGKIIIGSYGVRRAHRKLAKNIAPAPAPEIKPVKPKPQPKKVIPETELEEAPVIQSIVPPETEEVAEVKKAPKKTAKKPADETKPKTPKSKKTENPNENQTELL